MTQIEFAKKYINKTQGFWNQVLAGKRRLTFEDAEVVSSLLGTSLGLWMKRSAKPESRQRAWEKFQRRMRCSQ